MAGEETLGQKQERFALAVAQWVVAIYALGYRVRLGEVLRSDEQAEINALGTNGREKLAALIEGAFPALAAKVRNNTGSGIRNSLHEFKLALDANLFYAGQWISDGASPHWVKVGEMWEAAGADHYWGGRFGDGNHISIGYMGKK